MNNAQVQEISEIAQAEARRLVEEMALKQKEEIENLKTEIAEQYLGQVQHKKDEIKMTMLIHNLKGTLQELR